MKKFAFLFVLFFSMIFTSCATTTIIKGKVTYYFPDGKTEEYPATRIIRPGGEKTAIDKVICDIGANIYYNFPHKFEAVSYETKSNNVQVSFLKTKDKKEDKDENVSHNKRMKEQLKSRKSK